MWMNTVIRGTQSTGETDNDDEAGGQDVEDIHDEMKQVSRDIFNPQMKKTIQTFTKIDREEREEVVDPSTKRWMNTFMTTCDSSSFS